MELAPIGLTVYARLTHLKSTVKALEKNRLASQSKLYVFSDGPRAGDEDRVAEVRSYVRTIEGFKSVTLIERSNNSRIENNRGGQKFLLEKYGKMIWLEEDIVSAPGLISYLNEALEFYKDNKRVLSITGYCPPFPVNSKKSESDFFVLKRCNAWGMAIWKDKYDLIKEIDADLLTNSLSKKLRLSGDDIPNMVQLDLKGEINALDVRAMFWQNVLDLFTVYPRNSLVQNIGFDGSGVHCGASDKFHHEALWSKSSGFKFDAEPCLEKEIVRENQRFRRIELSRKVFGLLPRRLKGFLIEFLKPKAIQNRI